MTDAPLSERHRRAATGKSAESCRRCLTQAPRPWGSRLVGHDSRMGLLERTRHASALAGMLVKRPSQVRYGKAWVSNLRRPTMSSRLPWLPFSLIDALERQLQTNSKVLEFGGGGSTLWFAERVSEVITIEHDPEWYRQISAAVEGVPSCSVLFRSSEADYAEYVDAVHGFADSEFGVALVDGRQRVRCFEAAMPKVCSGGWIVLDDSSRERYQPAFDLARDWTRMTFEGFAPYKPVPAVTTVWIKP
jgi:hypothetical protein